ncbi:lipopolysaccharide assembly protein LapA domain-containing protein [Paenibacillus sediminis]|uniref:Integral membrane protein n=1 Tax=Paenibacillus sediminis TaxID=664909 RepID=A0ABS4H696_9BACL|nr:lipopolysaccharide assembly protein LapA domain-containing protein [Paenibacillus sediminis]MBP1937762.1 putative integral membrane protein [Paenibacillus sediminis]
MRKQWSLIAGLLFALLIAIFAVINVSSVEVNLLFSTVQIPLILLILGCTLIGGIIVGSYGIYRQYKLQRTIKSLSAKLVHIEEATGYVFPEKDTKVEEPTPANQQPNTH